MSGAVSAWAPAVVPSWGVNTIAIRGTTVYLGGSFESVGGEPRGNLAAVDATSGALLEWNPGTTGGGVGRLFVLGDTVFVDHCGRCDFEGSSPEQMFDSLHRVLKALPDDTVLYPGHDYGAVPVSTLGRERQVNPYFLADTLAKFLGRRVG